MNVNPTTDPTLRVALVTGSTSGIGAAIARKLNHAGLRRGPSLSKFRGEQVAQWLPR